MIAEDIEELEIDEDNLDVKAMGSEIKDYWSQFKYGGQELKYGTITKVFEHGKNLVLSLFINFILIN